MNKNFHISIFTEEKLKEPPYFFTCLHKQRIFNIQYPIFHRTQDFLSYNLFHSLTHLLITVVSKEDQLDNHILYGIG